MVPQGPFPGNDSLPHSVAFTCGRAHATCAPCVAEALRALLQMDVARWHEHGLQRIKERTVRSIFRGDLAGVPVHMKVFRADTFADRARDVVRKPRGESEASNLARTRCLDLPVVEPLASGLATDGEQLRSFVVTRTVLGAAPFEFPATPLVQQRTGTLLRQMHDRGLVPGDLHPGNLVIDRDGAPWLLDLTSVRHGGQPGQVRRAAALAFFCQALDGGALDPEAKVLLSAYRTAGEGLPESFDQELRLATHRWRAGALPAFGRRCTRNCRHTEVADRQRGCPRWTWHLRGDLDASTRVRCTTFADTPPPPDKTGRRGAVWVHDDLAVKERAAGTARKLWRATYWLLFARVAAPTPIALRLHRGRGLVFLRRVGNESLATELQKGRLDPRAIAAAAASLGNSVGRLHAHGLGNRDLKFDNLVRNPQSSTVYMVDLDGVSRGSVTDTRGRGKDLGRLVAAFRAASSPGGPATTRTFLRHYLRANRRLLQQPPMRRILLRAEQRAGEWAREHGVTNTPGS